MSLLSFSLIPRGKGLSILLVFSKNQFLALFFLSIVFKIFIYFCSSTYYNLVSPNDGGVCLHALFGPYPWKAQPTAPLGGRLGRPLY